MAFAAVTILMDTLHQHFLQPAPRFPLRNRRKVKLLYKNLSSLQTCIEQDFKVGECDEAIKALEAQTRDASVQLRFEIEHQLTLFYLGKAMKLRLASAKKLLPIFRRAIEEKCCFHQGHKTMYCCCMFEMVEKHFTLPVSGMPPHIKKRVRSLFRKHHLFVSFERWVFSFEEVMHMMRREVSIIRQELRASYLNKYMKQRIQARHRIRQILM